MGIHSRIGGAYRFDGKDDVIKISDGGAGYYNNVNSSTNNRELGGYGDWNGVTVEAWIYLQNNTAQDSWPRFELLAWFETTT
jgi:hypothetical protein